MLTTITALLLVAAAPDLPEGYIVIAHRGVVTETITENSLQSLEAAIARGYTHMEVDLRSTKDGHAVCLHDSSLERTTGVDKKIHEITLDELHELVDEDTVPSFETFCARAAGRIGLMPDIKDTPRRLISPFAKSLEASMKKHNLMDDAYFIGRRDVMEAMDRGGRVSVGPGSVAEKNPESADGLFVFGHAKDFNAENVAAFQKRGLPVIVSINTFHYREGDPIAQGIADVKRMRALGVDGLQIDSVYDAPLFGVAK